MQTTYTSKSLSSESDNRFPPKHVGGTGLLF